jgi:CAAX prenyl protease-like protein
MNLAILMSTATSIGEATPQRATRSRSARGVAVEVLLIYAGILYYIWHWQFTFPRAWMALWAAVLLSHLAHRDTLRALGLGWAHLRASAQAVFPLVLVLYLPLVIYGFARHALTPLAPDGRALVSFLRYGAWCLFQQYLTQSYFHNRLLNLVSSRHLSSLLVGVMFGSAHIPNPILMVATTLGGFIFAEIFARYRNIWPLALAQAVGGVLIAAVSPPSLIHSMRVGPGYFFYRL